MPTQAARKTSLADPAGDTQATPTGLAVDKDLNRRGPVQGEQSKDKRDALWAERPSDVIPLRAGKCSCNVQEDCCRLGLLVVKVAGDRRLELCHVSEDVAPSSESSLGGVNDLRPDRLKHLIQQKRKELMGGVAQGERAQIAGLRSVRILPWQDGTGPPSKTET